MPSPGLHPGRRPGLRAGAGRERRAGAADRRLAGQHRPSPAGARMGNGRRQLRQRQRPCPALAGAAPALSPGGQQRLAGKSGARRAGDRRPPLLRRAGGRRPLQRQAGGAAPAGRCGPGDRRLGLRPRHRRRADQRQRAQRAARRDREPAAARHDRRRLGRALARLARAAGALCRHPLPRRRPGRRRLGDRLHLHRAGGPAERALCRPAGERRGCRARRLLRPPAQGPARFGRRVPGLHRDLHGLWQLPGHEPLAPLRDVSRRAARAGAERPLPQRAAALR